MKFYMGKQGFLQSYCKIILPQVYICLRFAANSNLQKNLAPFFLCCITHQTACQSILHSQLLLMNSLCNYYSQIEVWLIYKFMFDNSRTKQMHRTWRDTENIFKFKPIIKFLHNRGHSELQFSLTPHLNSFLQRWKIKDVRQSDMKFAMFCFFRSCLTVVVVSREEKIYHLIKG